MTTDGQISIEKHYLSFQLVFYVVCGAGYKESSGVCVFCGNGYYKVEASNNDTCTACVRGKSTEMENATSPTDCSKLHSTMSQYRPAIKCVRSS